MVLSNAPASLSAPGGAAGGAEIEDGPAPARELGGRTDPGQDKVRRELRAIAESNPASVAQLIRTWLAEDRH